MSKTFADECAAFVAVLDSCLDSLARHGDSFLLAMRIKRASLLIGSGDRLSAAASRWLSRAASEGVAPEVIGSVGDAVTVDPHSGVAGASRGLAVARRLVAGVATSLVASGPDMDDLDRRILWVLSRIPGAPGRMMLKEIAQAVAYEGEPAPDEDTIGDRVRDLYPYVESARKRGAWITVQGRDLIGLWAPLRPIVAGSPG